MIFCADIGLRSVTAEQHVAPEEPGRPLSRLLCDGVELCNALEAVEWQDDLVQVTRCTGCHNTGCADGGYVRVSRLVDWVHAQPEAAVDGRFERADLTGARLETLYFEGPGADDWPAFAHVGDGELALAFGRGWVFRLAQLI